MRAVWLTALRKPRLAVALSLALPLLAAPGLLRLELRTDALALVPTDSAGAIADAAVRARFGIADPLAILVESSAARGIWTAEALELVARLSAQLLALEELEPAAVFSLATERQDRVRPGTLDFRPWLDPLPRSAAELDSLRDSLVATDIYRGTLLSQDEPVSATAVLVEIPPDAERTALVRRIEALVEGCDPPPGVRVYAVGAPVAETRLGEHILRDLALLVPISIAIMAALFWLVFRCWPAVALPLLEVGTCLLLTFAAMGWSKTPVYLTIVILPVILTAVGVADEIHVFSCFVRRRRANPAVPLAECVAGAMEEMARPVVMTSLTTALGFLVFAASPIAAVRAFGLFMALGVLLCMAWSLVVLPACLVALGPRALSAASGDRLPAALAGPLQRALRGLLSVRAQALGAVLVLAALAGWGALRVRIQDSWIDGFAPASATRRDTGRANALFGGTHLLQISVGAERLRREGELATGAVEGDRLLIPALADADLAHVAHHTLTIEPLRPRALQPFELELASAARTPRGVELTVVSGQRSLERRLRGVEHFSWRVSGRNRIVHPALLAEIGRLEDFLATLTDLGVGRVLGPREHLATMNWMLHARDPAHRVLPPDVARTQAVLEHYERARGADRLTRLLDPERSAGLVTVFLRAADFTSTAALYSVLERYEREHLTPLGLALELGGDLARSQALVGGVVRTQTRSVFLGLAAIALAAAVLARSLFLGLLCTLPALLALLVDYAAMGLLGIPLGVATSMFAGATIAIGVDYAIHLTQRCRRSAAEGRSEPLFDALEKAGPAIVIDALALACAFSVLALSSTPPTARLGGLMVASLLTCCAGSLLLLPLLLRPRG